MPQYLIELHVFTHTCRADPRPHVVEIARLLKDTISTGVCTNPQTFTVDGTATTIDCGRTVPHDRRCPACSVTVTVVSTVTRDLGHQEGHPAIAQDGLLPDPCPRCGLAVAAIFADTGRHVLCNRRRGRR
jgi:hypothetical protein